MGTCRYEMGMAKPQHLLFGFDPGIVVPRLTQKNWRKAALVNLREGQRVYCYIERRKLVPELGAGCVYGLAAHDLDTNDRFGPWSWDFPTLKEALAEANKGEPIDPALLQRRHAEVSLVGVRRIPPAPSAPPPPRDFIAELVELYAKGDRRPIVLEVLDKLAFSFFHGPLEAPPGVQLTPLERDLRVLRAYEPFAGKTDVELLTLHQTNPMLMAEVEHEIALQELLRRTTNPPR
jgi:hypothetical protein